MRYTTTTLARMNMVIVAIVLLILVYAARQGFFHSDDFTWLETIKFQVVDDPTAIFTQAEFIGGGGHYRPVAKLVVAAEYVVFGLNPLGYFVMRILLFLANMVVLFFLAELLLGDIRGAHITVLLFLLQGNTYLYTVNWIGAVTNILVGIFITAACLFYVRSTLVRRRALLSYVASLICFALALLSRETAVVVIPVILVYDFLFLWPPTPSRTQGIVKRLPYYAPFLILLACALFAQNASGARELASFGYTWANIPAGLFFFAQHLGFMPLAVVLLTVLSWVADRPRLQSQSFRPAVWGLSLAAAGVLPFLLLGWTSPTWLYLPALGTTLATATLLHQVLSSTPKRTLLFFASLMVWAVIGNGILFSELNRNRWWQWGEYTRNVIEQVQAQYPTLSPGTTLLFIDKDEGKPYGLQGLFRTQHNLQSAFRVWYNDFSLSAYVSQRPDSAKALPQVGPTTSSLVFEYDEGSILSHIP